MPGRHEAAYPDRLVEWLFATMLALWGVYLLLPMRSFAHPHYAVLAALADERVWAALALALAVIRMVVLTVNGRWRRTPAIRLACSVCGFTWWLAMIFLTLSAGAENPPPVIAWYPAFALFEAIACWRSAADGFHSGAFRCHGRPLLRLARRDA